MQRFKRYYILSIIFLILSLLAGSACDGVPPTDSGLPIIDYFYADPHEVMPADAATLHWNVSGASIVTIEPGVGEVAISGETGVAPLENTTYILTASNEVGSVTATTEVIGCDLIATTVDGPPPAKPSVLDPKAPKSPLKPTEESGSTETKATDTPLKLTDEPSSQQLKVVLPIIHSFRADPESIYVGSPTKLRWEVSNADAIAITALKFSETKLSSSGSIIVSPTTTIEYTLKAINSSGSRIQIVTVTVIEPKTMKTIPPLEPVGLPIIHYFRADPETITEGESSVLSWEVSNADAVYYHGPWVGMEVDSVGSVTKSPNTTQTYMLEATNSVGSVIQDVTVNVIQVITPPKILEIAKPDLVVTDIWRSGPTNWYFTVKNEGLIESPGMASVRIIPGSGQDYQYYYIPKLAVGQTIDCYITYKYPCTSGMNDVWSVFVDWSNHVDESNEDNNYRSETFTCPQIAKPDLVVTDIWKSGSTQWHYIVKNQGNVECSGSSSELRIDGKGQASQIISPLAPGESREFYFSHKFACESGTSHTWSVVADLKNAIDESDEDNNSRTGKFTCSK